MRALRRITFPLFLVLVSLVTSYSLFAQESEGLLNKLLAPGPLIEGHKQLEETGCLSCHQGGKGVPDSKCLDCHKEIRPFIDGKYGFHGLHKESCRECHSDHKGRTFDPIKFDIKNFNHAETGFKLTGKHAEVKCLECHTATRKGKKIRTKETRWFGQAKTCVSCHKKDDVHYFKSPWNKKDCNACHGVTKWTTEIRFDHEKDAKYKLEAKHVELKCAECHVPKIKEQNKNSIYKWPTLKTKYCMSCHENYHATTMQPKYQTGKCDTCHTQQSFKIERFDHSVTGFKLREKHAEIKCVDCHKQKRPETPISDKKFVFKGLKADCLSCHKDYHLFGPHKSTRLKSPNQCIDCHNERDWKQIHSFTHNQDTRYVIDGKHEGLKCTECHIPQLHMKPPQAAKVGKYYWAHLTDKTCENCHQSPHTREFSPEFLKKRCTECHVTTGWKDMAKQKNFDHSKTRFALTDKHAELKCADCHSVKGKQVFRFKHPEQKFCIDCHENVHTQQFHPKFASQTCTECHTTKNFTERRAFDHETTSFPLKGEHAKVKCEECHKTTTDMFPGKSKNLRRQYLFPKVAKDGCITCHADYHKGQLTGKCSDCHNEKGWKPVQFDHDLQSRFELRGAHEKLKCKECHKPVPREEVTYKKRTYPLIRYKPLGMACVDCHEDVHRGQMGNRCVDCHNEKDWRSTRDFHKNFTLAGVHYSLSCAECHVDRRKLSGMSHNCQMCHQKDDIHNGTLPNCGECHRQQFWENSEYKHSMTRFPLRGVHRTLDCVECHSRGIYQGAPTTCVACHLQDALAVTNPSHAGFSNLTTCTECHRNQFTFKNP